MDQHHPDTIIFHLQLSGDSLIGESVVVIFYFPCIVLYILFYFLIFIFFFLAVVRGQFDRRECGGVGGAAEDLPPVRDQRGDVAAEEGLLPHREGAQNVLGRRQGGFSFIF